MARTEARLLTSVWADPDWRALPTVDAQWLYVLLLSQGDMTHVGVISMSVRRWSSTCAGMTQKRVQAALEVLQEYRFVFFDEETEEVLVRSMLRRDGAWRSFKTLAPAVSAARTIMSPRLRAVLAQEVARLDPAELPEPSETSKVDNKARVTALLEEIRAILTPRDTPPEGVSEGVSDALPEAPSDTPSHSSGKGYAKPLPIGTGVGVGVGVGASSPVVTSVGDASAADDAPAKARARRIPADWQPTETDLRYAREHGVQDTRRLVEEFRTYWQGDGGRKLDWSATFKNRVLQVTSGGRGNVRALPRASNGFDINTIPLHERWKYQ